MIMISQDKYTKRSVFPCYTSRSTRNPKRTDMLSLWNNSNYIFVSAEILPLKGSQKNLKISCNRFSKNLVNFIDRQTISTYNFDQGKNQG